MALLKFRKGTGSDPNTVYLNENFNTNTYQLSVGNKKVKEPISIEEVGQSFFGFSTEDLYIIEVSIDGMLPSTTQIIKSGQELIKGVTVGGVGTFNTQGSPEVFVNLFQYSFMVKIQPDIGVQGEYNVSYSNEQKNIIVGNEDNGLFVINVKKKLFKLN